MGEQLGKVAQWHDDKGYGFIAALDAEPGPRAFFHIRDYEQAGRRPEAGEIVRFTARRDGDGRLRASGVRRAARPVRTSRPVANRPARGPSALLSGALVLVHAGLMTWGIIEGRLPGLLPFAVGVACAVTYTAYALDKHAARRGRWRIPESTLHLLELLGGWPGALLAQHLLHHKTRKAAYRQAFWKVVILHCAVLAGWILYWDRLPF